MPIKECLVATYSRAAENLKKLKDLGCTILHEVNAHTMGCHPPSMSNGLTG
jgi:25S rRNA (uracil2634-N3)-methyltransferase